MNNILSPEKNKHVLKKYHLSSKMCVPLLASSLFLHNCKFDFINNKVENLVHFATLTNFAYHSYISTSCILTDYVKPKLLSNVARCSSLGLHSVAIIGYYKILYKNITH